MSMNQTESGRKAEGSGVGILCETRPAASVRSAASASGEPRLWLRTYLAAPDGLAVVVTDVELNRPGAVGEPQKTCGPAANH